MPKISELTELGLPSGDDVISIIDVSDTTFGSTGTNKKIKVSNLKKGFSFLLSNVGTINIGSVSSPTILDGWTTEFINTLAEYQSGNGSVKNLSGKNIPLLFGTIQLKPIVNSGNKTTLYMYSEYSTDGTTWTKTPDSLRQFNLDNETNMTIVAPSLFRNLAINSMVRLRLFTAGSVSLVAPSMMVNGSNVTGFSCLWELEEKA